MLRAEFKRRLLMNLVGGLFSTAWNSLLWPLTPYFICNFLFDVCIYVLPIFDIVNSIVAICGLLFVLSMAKPNVK